MHHKIVLIDKISARRHTIYMHEVVVAQQVKWPSVNQDTL